MAVAIAQRNAAAGRCARHGGALNAHLIPLSPREFQFQMTVEQMAGPDTVLFVARDGAARRSAWAR
jgi:putative acetyltransferase